MILAGRTPMEGGELKTKFVRRKCRGGCRGSERVEPPRQDNF